jgi:acetyl-CoA carboxylase biotin carboxyl carrier protein
LDPSKIYDLDDLEELVKLMGRYGLSELEIEGEGRRIRLKKPGPEVAATSMPYGAPSAAAVSSSAAHPAHSSLSAGASPADTPADASSPGLRAVASPMVGTFYRAQSPEADPYVREGDRVEEGSILCIIEAMKVMNEIPAGIAGVVREILVKNGESVEYGQPLFRISVE